jgi:hypothetical protein
MNKTETYTFTIYLDEEEVATGRFVPEGTESSGYWITLLPRWGLPTTGLCKSVGTCLDWAALKSGLAPHELAFCWDEVER